MIASFVLANNELLSIDRRSSAAYSLGNPPSRTIVIGKSTDVNKIIFILTSLIEDSYSQIYNEQSNIVSKYTNSLHEYVLPRNPSDLTDPDSVKSRSNSISSCFSNGSYQQEPSTLPKLGRNGEGWEIPMSFKKEMVAETQLESTTVDASKPRFDNFSTSNLMRKKVSTSQRSDSGSYKSNFSFGSLKRSLSIASNLSFFSLTKSCSPEYVPTTIQSKNDNNACQHNINRFSMPDNISDSSSQEKMADDYHSSYPESFQSTSSNLLENPFSKFQERTSTTLPPLQIKQTLQSSSAEDLDELNYSEEMLANFSSLSRVSEIPSSVSSKGLGPICEEFNSNSSSSNYSYDSLSSSGSFDKLSPVSSICSLSYESVPIPEKDAICIDVSSIEYSEFFRQDSQTSLNSKTFSNNFDVSFLSPGPILEPIVLPTIAGHIREFHPDFAIQGLPSEDDAKTFSKFDFLWLNSTKRLKPSLESKIVKTMIQDGLKAHASGKPKVPFDPKLLFENSESYSAFETEKDESNKPRTSNGEEILSRTLVIDTTKCSITEYVLVEDKSNSHGRELKQIIYNNALFSRYQVSAHLEETDKVETFLTSLLFTEGIEDSMIFESNSRYNDDDTVEYGKPRSESNAAPLAEYDEEARNTKKLNELKLAFESKFNLLN